MFVKTYGIFTLEQLTSNLFGKKMISHKFIFRDLDKKELCNLITKSLEDTCELYLFMEAGEYDLKKYMENPINRNFYKFINELNELTDMFFNLINFYKINEYFLEKINKVFIHSDIKPENMIVVDENNNKIIKLIDFGISTLNESFYNFIAEGTPYLYNILFDGNNNNKLFRRSILFDIFCVILSYIQILIYKITAFSGEPINIMKNIVYNKLTFEQLCNRHKSYMINILSEEQFKKYYKLKLLGLCIYKFFKIRIELYNTNIKERTDITDELKTQVYNRC